jgi:hypothetical protein
MENLSLVFCLLAITSGPFELGVVKLFMLVDHKYMYEIYIEYVFMLTVINMMEMRNSEIYITQIKCSPNL